jgi:hypothetical protein
MSATMPCFKCGKELTTHDIHVIAQTFESSGGLHLNICDHCILDNKGRISNMADPPSDWYGKPIPLVVGRARDR